MDREALGRMVRDEWVTWAREQPNPKPSLLLLWEELSEPDREIARRIGERLARAREWEHVQMLSGFVQFACAVVDKQRDEIDELIASLRRIKARVDSLKYAAPETHSYYIALVEQAITESLKT